MLAGARKIDSPDPRKYGINIRLSGEDVRRYSPTDIPINRAAFAIRQEYGADLKMFTSIMFRFMALIEVLQGRRLKKWRRPDPDDKRAEEVHPAVIHAAATEPLNDQGYFTLSTFQKAVERIAKKEYPDEE